MPSDRNNNDFCKDLGRGGAVHLTKVARTRQSPVALIGSRQGARPHPGFRLRRDASGAEFLPTGQITCTTIYERMHGMAIGLPK